MNYTYHTDNGHGWLEVSAEKVRALGVSVTRYSYESKDEKILFLEEDCDMPEFLKALREAGEGYVVTEVYDGDLSPIRRLQRLDGRGGGPCSFDSLSKPAKGSWQEAGRYAPDHGCTED
jgi:hypothetical protein